MSFQDAAMQLGARRAPMPAPQQRAVDAAVTDDDTRYLPVDRLRKQYLDYLTGKIDEIEEQKESRRYYHGAQLSAEIIRILRDRHQPPMVWNRTSRKINSIVGLVERMRSDPKAMPNLPKSEGATEIATQAIRNVLSASDWKSVEPESMRRCAYAAIAGGGLALSRDKKGRLNVTVDEILDDEYFYDPKSVRYDFSDKRYDGIAKWFDLDAAIEKFPEQEELLNDLVENGSDLTTNADREYKWISTQSKRLRIVEHWYKHRGEWCYAFYCGSTLIDQGPSPWYDDDGNTMSRFVMFSAAIDHDGDRYSFVRNLKGPQDALNQSKSKSLHIANSRRLIMEKGAVDDVETARREWARPDGVVEKNPGREVTPDPTTADLAAFTQFSDDAKQEIDQFGNFNFADVNPGQLGSLSGRAIELLRQPGMAELGPFILSYRGWKLRVYRGIWNAVQRYWTEERFLRIAGDEEEVQFLQINGLALDQFGQPVMVNPVSELDVDIELEEGPDVASLMQETYEALKGYPPGTFPPQVLIELAPLRRSDKKRILQMLSPPPQPADPIAELAKQLSVQQLHAQNQDLAADAVKKHAEARKTLAQVEQTEADAMEKRSRIIANAAKASKDAVAAHLEPARFALDAMNQASQQANESAETALPESGAPAMPPAPILPQPPQAFPPPFPV